MKTGREPLTNDDDAAPVEMLAQLFEAHGWPCEFVSDDEISGEIQGSWTTYQMRGIWRAEDRVLQLLCLPEIRVPQPKRADAFELLGLINEQLWLGHFDLWRDDGMLLYRNGLLLSGAKTHVGQCEGLLKAALEACERYYQSFQFVLWAGRSAEEALAATMLETQGHA